MMKLKNCTIQVHKKPKWRIIIRHVLLHELNKGSFQQEIVVSLGDNEFD
jgi:hypothetical protein